ncbi:MAG: hypothetical protein JWO97_3049 [Acidobacteria bacterium]|nr:hypothetical protein [Acidobacteriota bacterium]
MDASTIAALKHNPGQTITLYPSKVKWTLMLLFFSAAIGVGVVMIRQGEPIGWLMVLFFGLGIAASLLQFTGRGNYLQLEPDSFTIGTTWRKTAIAWRDVEEFRTVKIRRSRFVGYLLRGEAASRLARANRVMAGVDGMLPDNFGIAVDELRAIFEQRRHDAAAARMRER